MLLIATKSDTSSTQNRQLMKAAIKSCHKNGKGKTNCEPERNWTMRPDKRCNKNKTVEKKTDFTISDLKFCFFAPLKALV